ncbi:MAG: trypsin-like peptidase domain-containing protein [Solobacterium sp.]|nr:trypsin-like peptidase domain-containing protein [Solobacterium sp.]
MSEYDYRPERKRNRSHPVLTAALAGTLGLGGGFAGGYLANRTFASPSSVIYTSTETGTSPQTTAGSAATGMTVSDVAAKASPSVVEIITEVTQESYGFWGGTYTAQAAGSGVILSADGYIITNNHVVENANDIQVTTYDGKTYKAVLIGTDAKADIAVIKVEADSLIPAVIGDSSKVQAGDTAIVIGNPLGTLGGSVTSGIISSANRQVTIERESMNLIQTDAAINNGNSGGGLFDGNGCLIGIVNAKDSGTTSSGAIIEGLGFAIPVNYAMDVAQQLIDYGKVVNRPTIGVYLSQIYQSQGNYKAGLYITEVIEGSGAEEAGLHAYDRIVKADGIEISDYTDLSGIMLGKNLGDTIELVIDREGQEMTFIVTLNGTAE